MSRYIVITAQLDALNCPIRWLDQSKTTTPIHDWLRWERAIAEAQVAVNEFAEIFKRALLRYATTAQAKEAAMTAFLSRISLDDLDDLGGFHG